MSTAQPGSVTVPIPSVDVVRVTNTGKDDLTLQHDRYGTTVIPPGESAAVNLAVAVTCFGNPGARNSGRERYRDLEIRRVRRRWGFYDGLMNDWENYCPEAEVHDLEGNRLWMIHDDPEGTEAATGLSQDVSRVIEESDDPVALARKMQEIQARQLAQAREELADEKANARHTTDIPEAPKKSRASARRDSPRAPRSGSSTTSSSDDS